MTRALVRVVVPALVLLSAVSCTRNAVRPPSPAQHLDVTGLDCPPPGERYYVTVFGSQSVPRLARFTHTWATVVRVTERGPGQPPCVEPHTISWMPATLVIHPLHFYPEPGVNLELHQTIKEMIAHNERVAQWGPFECRPRVFHRFLVQKEFMESGQVGYQCIDDVGASSREGTACDCIHAITDMDPQFDRRHYPLRRFGHSASRFIVKQLYDRDILIDRDRTHDWLNDALGLNGYPIERKTYP
jgi:hypothetical protein